MKHNLFTFILIGLCIFSSCQKENTILEYTIDTRSKPLHDGKILLSMKNNHYLYDLKIANSFCLLFDDLSDTTFWAYKIGTHLKPIATMEQHFKRIAGGKPLFTKEIDPQDKKSDTIFWVKNNLYCKSLILNSTNNETNISTLHFNNKNKILSYDFNLTTKDTYAIPIVRNRKNPFYLFNQDSGYYWVDPSPSIEKIMPNDVLSYTNTICLNESQNTIVSAYRFTNYISFYKLNGILKTTVKFGEKPIIPIIKSNQNKIDIKNTSKCFTYICGTPQYVYCLYDGSSDFTAPSKIAIFQWNGKHIATRQADRNLRAIAVDKKNKYILAIASNYNGQDIIKYNLE